MNKTSARIDPHSLPRYLPLLCACVLAGCGTLGRTAYQSPAVTVPAVWQTQVTGKALVEGRAWWRAFQDPALDNLIEEVLRRNNDLAAATYKVQRARLQSGLADTNLTPNVRLGGDASARNRLEDNSQRSRSFGASLSLNYEVDLWGKLSAARDAAAWEAQATEQDRQATALALIGTTANLYWKLAYLNQRMVNSVASINYAEKTLALTQSKFRAGAVSRIDVMQAERNLASQQAEHTQLVQQQTETRHAMAILFDQPPEEWVKEKHSLEGVTIPAVAAGIPAELLGRRPDLQAAEYRLRRLLAEVDQVRTSYYPALTLTGSAGETTAKLRELLRDPVGSLGVSLILPFVEYRTMRLKTQISQTQYDEAVVNFRQTLYKSLTEVEDTLSARIQYQEQGRYLHQALEAAKEAERLVEIRYRAGKTSMQSWLDQQNARRTGENAWLQNQLNRLSNAMSVYQVLGGSGEGIVTDVKPLTRQAIEKQAIAP